MRRTAGKVNTYDIIYPVYGPSVGVLTHYCSDEKGRQDYYPLETMYLVMAFAFKNLAIVHQQYFNDPVGGYHKGYDYYGDQFAACFIRHLKGNAARYHIDPQKICCFGCSKGSEVPGMLVNKLRGTPPFLYEKADAKKISLTEKDKTIASPFADLSTEIACAILGPASPTRRCPATRCCRGTTHPRKTFPRSLSMQTIVRRCGTGRATSLPRPGPTESSWRRLNSARTRGPSAMPTTGAQHLSTGAFSLLIDLHGRLAKENEHERD